MPSNAMTRRHTLKLIVIQLTDQLPDLFLSAYEVRTIVT